MFAKNMVIEVVGVAAVTSILVLLYHLSRRKTVERMPPSLRLLPLLRSIITGGLDVLPEYFQKAAENLGPVISFRAGGRLTVVLNGYEAVFGCLMRHSEDYAGRATLWVETKLVNPNRKGIIFVPYSDIYRKRQKLTLSILKEFGFGESKNIEVRILDEVEKLMEEIRQQEGHPFEPHDMMSIASSNVVLSMLFGKEFLCSWSGHRVLVEAANEYMGNLDPVINMAPLVRFLPKYRKKIVALVKSNERMMEMLAEAIEHNKSRNSSELSFVGRFLDLDEEPGRENHENLLFILRDLVIGNMDTVSALIVWALLELANHPEIQSRFQNELDQLIPGKRLPSLEDKPRLPYTEAFILEVMRYHTLVPLVLRATTKDTEAFGCTMPKNCHILPNVYSVHMEQGFWKDPENFRPERFLDNDGNIIASARKRIIPFGLGKRSCIGEVLARQEVFLFFTSLVQQFEILPPEDQHFIHVRNVCSITVIASSFKVRLLPRRL